MTRVHRRDCGEPQIACCCHLRAPVALRHTCHSPYCWLLSCPVCASCAACAATLAPRDALTLLADETVDDAGDAAFERVRAEVRRRLVGGAT